MRHAGVCAAIDFIVFAAAAAAAVATAAAFFSASLFIFSISTSAFSAAAIRAMSRISSPPVSPLDAYVKASTGLRFLLGRTERSSSSSSEEVSSAAA